MFTYKNVKTGAVVHTNHKVRGKLWAEVIPLKKNEEEADFGAEEETAEDTPAELFEEGPAEVPKPKKTTKKNPKKPAENGGE